MRDSVGLGPSVLPVSMHSAVSVLSGRLKSSALAGKCAKVRRACAAPGIVERRSDGNAGCALVVGLGGGVLGIRVYASLPN